MRLAAPISEWMQHVDPDAPGDHQGTLHGRTDHGRQRWPGRDPAGRVRRDDRKGGDPMLLMGDLLRRRAGPADARRTALIFGEERWTYGRLNAAANRLANWLIASGIRPGDRVALLGHNSAEWVVAYFAAAKAGAILVPASYWFKGDELRYVLSDSGARLLIAERDFADLVNGERGGLA